jgi:hypothetical protein
VITLFFMSYLQYSLEDALNVPSRLACLTLGWVVLRTGAVGPLNSKARLLLTFNSWGSAFSATAELCS